MWSVNFTVNNYTDYRADIFRKIVGKVGTIEPNGTYNTIVKSEDNNYSLSFIDVNTNKHFMQSFCVFGSKTGVSVDRGWIYYGDQTIKMTAQVNDKCVVQTTNGVIPVYNFNEFENGGTITLTFEKQ